MDLADKQERSFNIEPDIVLDLEDDIDAELFNSPEKDFKNRIFTVGGRRSTGGPRTRQPNQLRNNIPKKIWRRRRYAATQRVWDKDRGRLVKNILSGKDPLVDPPIPEGTKDHWKELFSKLSPPSHFQDEAPGDINILGSITIEEIEWLKRTLKLGTSPGPDRIRAEELKAARNQDIQRLYNSILRIKDIHHSWAKGFTTLIPKLDDPRTPSDFRPITITSILTRGLHKILGRRISRNISIDIRQKGFREGGGVGYNILILKEIIKQAKEQPRTTYLCFIHFSKAFDSVSHWALVDGLAAAGLDNDSVQYIRNYYMKAATTIMGEEANINRGVLQGDSMSPTIFNIVLQFALRKIPEAVGVDVGSVCIQYLAFADDIVVTASSRPGITMAVNTLLEDAAKISLGYGSVVYLDSLEIKRGRSGCTTTGLSHIETKRSL